jgi:hypothetical protein
VNIVFGLVAVVVLWAAVVGAFYGFMMAMVWLTSRIFRLTGRRSRQSSSISTEAARQRMMPPADR